MSTKFFIFILLSAGLVWLTACGKDNSTLEPRKGMGGAKASDQKAAKGAEKSADPTYVIRRQLMKALEQSHQVLEEGWKVAYASKGYSMPKSIFKAFLHRLQRHGFLLKSSYMPEYEECPFYISTLKEAPSNSQVMKSLEYRISQRRCGDNKDEEFFMVTAQGSNKFKIETSPSNSRMLELLGSQVNISTGGRKIVCEISLQDNGKLEYLGCENLGYALRSEKEPDLILSTRFDKFIYSASGLKDSKNADDKDILQLEATHFKDAGTNMCPDANKKCLVMNVPMKGRIQIIEHQSDAAEKMNAMALKTEAVGTNMPTTTVAPRAVNPAARGHSAAAVRNGADNGQNTNADPQNPYQNQYEIQPQNPEQNPANPQTPNLTPYENPNHGLEYIETPQI